MSKNLSELSGRKGLTENLFTRLGELSEKEGTPSQEDLEKLAEEFLVGTANTYGSATFYDFMKPENQGKKVYTCSGSVCMTANTQEELTKSLQKHFNKEEIGHMCCLGRCHENNAFHFQGKNYSAKSASDIENIIKGKSSGANQDDYKVGVLGHQVLTLPFPGVDTYYKLLAETLKRSPKEVLKEISVSEIRGRGGAGFPMSIKLAGCAAQENDQKFIVCNADEGDPGAYSDRYLLEKQPHSVLFGMIVAGYVTGANWGVVYIRGEYPESVQICEAAVKELYARGLIGENILESGFNFNFKVVKAQGAYICGEETALLSSLEGQRPEVRIRPPYPVQSGLFNKPTVVNNVETLAAIHYILQHGGANYVGIGTGKSAGTKLVCLDSFFKNPGVYEVDMGTPLKIVVNELGGGFTQKIKALHIGGPLGGLVPISKIGDLTVDFESFANNGFLLGHASVICIPASFPLIKYMEHLLEFTAEESCGKCFPCRLGSVRGAEMLGKAQNEKYQIDLSLFNDLIHTMETGSLCALGGGVPLPLRNAMDHFSEELKPYFSGK